MNTESSAWLTRCEEEIERGVTVGFATLCNVCNHVVRRRDRERRGWVAKYCDCGKSILKEEDYVAHGMTVAEVGAPYSSRNKIRAD